jgi:hypothetical protein
MCHETWIFFNCECEKDYIYEQCGYHKICVALRDANANLSNPNIFSEYRRNLKVCIETSTKQGESMDSKCEKHTVQEAQEALEKLKI